MNTRIDRRTLKMNLANRLITILSALKRAPWDDSVWVDRFFAIVIIPAKAGENAYYSEVWFLHSRPVKGTYGAFDWHNACCTSLGFVIVQGKPERVWGVKTLSNADREVGIKRGEYGKWHRNAVRRFEALRVFGDYVESK